MTRKYRIEIGYGLEGVLPDSLVGGIGRQYLVPYFKRGDYSTGIYAATLVIANEIASRCRCKDQRNAGGAKNLSGQKKKRYQRSFR